MKHSIILLSIILLSFTAKSQDTLNIKSIKVQTYKRGPAHKMKVDYVIHRDSEYIPVKNGKELIHLKSFDKPEAEISKK